MSSRGTQRPGPPGICGNTLAMVNAGCDLEASFRNRSPTFEKRNATFFAATTPRCKHSGERTRGILRDNDSRFPGTIELRTVILRHFPGFLISYLLVAIRPRCPTRPPVAADPRTASVLVY